MRTTILIVLLGLSGTLLAQVPETPPKFKLTGAARGIIFGDDLQQETEVPDTITAPKLSSGHTLVDLGLSIRPNASMEVFGMLRVRNDFGGFWGGGTTFDVRQIYVRGVVNNKIRYQLGDINYKLSPYTLFNPDQETMFGQPAAFRSLMDVVNYDNFYDFDNSWRQQGAAVDFGLAFRSGIEELNFNFFTSRVNRTNFSFTSERLFSGIHMEMVQSKYLTLGGTYVNMYDWGGTSRSNVLFNNPVITGQMIANYAINDWDFLAEAEVGQSRQYYRGTEEDPDISGGFNDLRVDARYTPLDLTLSLGWKNVSADFRSPGAQSKRIDFERVPDAYQRVTNDQVLRTFTMYDLMRETDLYRLQLSDELMAYDPRYDNITPYGAATPNRSGFQLGLIRGNENAPIHARASFGQWEEIRGQGTLNTKTFQRMELEASSHLDAFLNDWDKSIVLEVAYRNDQSARASEEGVQAVDLQTTLLSAGIEGEVFQKLYLTLAYQSLQYVGFDFLPVRGDFDQVVFFNEYEVDGSETMLGLGLKYAFSDSDALSIQLNNFQSTNAGGIIPNYEINQLAFLYVMKF